MSTQKDSEWLTRKRLIDPQLQTVGWRVTPYSPNLDLTNCEPLAIEEYPTDNGPADYALCAEGKILGIVEAKKLTLGPQNVLTQAERYSRGVTSNPFNFDGQHVPFLYSTNGEVIWHHDIRQPLNRSRRIARFHTPDALRERLAAELDQSLQALAALPNDHPRLRPYQIEANAAIEQAIVEHKRQMLVAMATGTGKTFTMVNQCYRLMKSGVAKRVLFLVDRRALAAQAVRAFASFEAEPGLKFDKIYEVYSQRFQREDFEADERFDVNVLPNNYLTKPGPAHVFVYVCTIQRMTINLFGQGSALNPSQESLDDDAAQLDIPNHAFDVVIADECHRGYTAQEAAIWRNTLDHFDAIKIGLTATPAAHTTSYFKHPVYRYEYERAVREGYLVDYDVVAVRSNVRMNGVFLDEGDEVSVVDPESGAEQLDLLEDERQFDATEVEQKVTAPDSNLKILEEIRSYATGHQQECGRFPKTLIFAVNDLPHTSHADQLVDIARDVFGRGDAFVQKITGRVDRPLQKIREFRNRQQIGIVVTVDLLSTGVDIPDLEFIVFLRPVKSRILFEQMLGRGTRKGEHFPDKSHFVVFDCFDGTLMEYFREATGITAEPVKVVPRAIKDIIEDVWQNRDRDYNVRVLAKRLQRIDKAMSGEAREVFAAHVPNGDLGAFARELSRRIQDDFTATLTILRNLDFQDLLLNYPRPQRTFIVAPGVRDDVSSEWRVRGTDGREYKPDDYIAAFNEFVQSHRTDIQAIGILLDRPRDWSAEVLQELRDKLQAAPQRFTENNLRQAHERHYQQALVDIISMVKRAARKEEPLYTAEQRVQRALTRILSSHEFSEAERNWLDRIRVHLIENLSIDPGDFDLIPALSSHGGLTRAQREFGGKLNELLNEINGEIAA